MRRGPARGAALPRTLGWRSRCSAIEGNRHRDPSLPRFRVGIGMAALVCIVRSEQLHLRKSGCFEFGSSGVHVDQEGKLVRVQDRAPLAAQQLVSGQAELVRRRWVFELNPPEREPSSRRVATSSTRCFAG
jgi:hypothetical protein